MQYEVLPAEPEAAQALGAACGVAATVGQVLLHRGLREPEAARDFLSARLAGLTPPATMADREIAAERLARAVRARERITVFGDYDVDGTTSAVILADVLEVLGGTVSVLVANRFEGGYGFSEQALDKVLLTRPGLIVTCDCGSSDHERIERAKAAGVDVIVIDHHLVPEATLPALAFLNPQRPECRFPYKGLSSVGLVLSVSAALRKALGAALDLRRWLDLVALGTIADAVPLREDNRRLVKAGLTLIASPHGRPGVAALCELARLRPGGHVSGADVAFRLVPRLNAPGRLADQSLTLALLRSRTLSEARTLAAEIEQLNERRKALQRGFVADAIGQVLEVYGGEPDHGIVAAARGWHRGVVGIVAARLVERFRVPALVAAVEGDTAHGSGRTPKGFALYDAVARCRPLLTKFGGHQAAVGFSLPPARLDELRAAFADSAPAADVAACASTGVAVDACLDGSVFDLPPASEMALLEPLGHGNDAPLFVIPDAVVRGRKIVGEDHLRLNLRIRDQSVVALGIDLGARAGEVRAGMNVRVVGTLKPDGWRGGDALEMRVLDFGAA
ncbi:MAG: single-stranded-DNA-specific exonuclease RecJ [Proteobacteria bacterium]|nr:single-stranded-DNA-specific exonuclease RecJ [Pseudomonadota bacterium]